MDYKVIIILLALLFLIILVYREISTFKEQIAKSITNMVSYYKETSEEVIDKFQSGMTKYVNQIKLMVNWKIHTENTIDKNSFS